MSGDYVAYVHIIEVRELKGEDLQVRVIALPRWYRRVAWEGRRECEGVQSRGKRGHTVGSAPDVAVVVVVVCVVLKFASPRPVSRVSLASRLFLSK